MVDFAGGHPVYSAYFETGMGYRNIQTMQSPPAPANGTAVGHEPESMYMVTSGKHFNNHCCFDYGNAEVNGHDDGDGTMVRAAGTPFIQIKHSERPDLHIVLILGAANMRMHNNIEI
jgi:hypothetical protein